MSYERFLNIMFSPCVYCGAPPSGHMTCKDGSVLRVSTVDRIDAARGYDAANVVPACGSCNAGKGRMTATAFLEHVAQIYHYQHLENRR